MSQDPAPEPVLFETVLTPNRSLSEPGFVLLMAFFGVVSFVAGMAFMRLGAWPVVGFFGLDVALLYLAFRLNYRAGLLREHLKLTASALDVARTLPGGRAARWHFQPYWVRVDLKSPEEHHCEVSLTSHGRRLVIGAFLAPEQRVRLAHDLRAALQRAKAPEFA